MKEKNKPKSKENRKSQKKKNIHINTDIINENNKTLKDNCKEQIDKKVYIGNYFQIPVLFVFLGGVKFLLFP